MKNCLLFLNLNRTKIRSKQILEKEEDQRAKKKLHIYGCSRNPLISI